MADPVLQPFATVAQFEDFWKQLSTDEETRALSILTLASNRLRMRGEQVGVDVQAKHDASEAYASTLQWVVMEATKRAMLTPVDAPPANSVQQTAGPYSSNIVFTNPSGDLWFKKIEMQDLGLGGIQRLSSISTVPGSKMYDAYEIPESS